MVVRGGINKEIFIFIISDFFPAKYCKLFITITNVTRFWKTDHFVTFGIIYISVNLGHSIWHYWFNKWLNQSQTS